MRTKKRALPALIFSLFAAAAAPSASAQQFSNVYIFGDSLSDVGYYRPVLTALGLPPSLVATLGRFTTSPGPVWSELVTQYYGSTPSASNVNGGNVFAQGGARVATNSASTPQGAAQRPVSTQVTEFLSRNGGAADPNALYAIWAGANDVIQTLQGAGAGLIPADQVPGIIQNTAAAEIQQIGRLQAAGARYIIVIGLPNIGATPGFTAAGAATAATATQLSAGFNTALFAGLAQAGIRVIPVDAFPILAELRANPSLYGFTNVTTPACGAFPPFSTTSDAFFCPPNVQAPGGATSYLFADGIHPTTATHAIIAEVVEQMISGPTAYSMLAETPIHTRANHVRTLTDGIAQGEHSPASGWNVFVAADGSKFDADMPFGKAGSHNTTFTVGATARVSDSVVLGAAVGKNRADGSFGGDMGGYGTDELVFSVIGGARWGGLYGNAVLSVANIEYRNLHRNITLGPTVRTATADTSGSNESAFFELGYDFRVQRFTIGPTVSVSVQDVDVNSFDESADAGAMALKIGAQRRKSEVWSAGVRASYNMGNWTPWLRVTADKERKDDPRVVTATPLSLATGNSYDVPAYMPDSNYVTGWIGINGSLDERIGLSVSYYYVSGRSGVKEDGVGALVSYRF